MSTAPVPYFLTAEQRRLLNVMFDLRGPNNVKSVLLRADASIDDLHQLQDEHGLSHTLLYNSTPVNLRNLHDTRHADRWRAQVGLTRRGSDWVTGNPTNVLLRSVDRKPGRRMNLAEALGFSDKKTIFDAVEADLLVLHQADNGEPVSQFGRTATITPAEFNFASQFTLVATAKIRKVLG